MKPLVEIEHLTLALGQRGRSIVRDFSLSIAPGEFVGIVGESGSGKTQAARAILGLTPPPLVRTAGSIRVEGEELTTATPARLRALRGARIGMVFQEPMTSLNPSMTIGRQLDEGLALHRPTLVPAERRTMILAMLAKVGLSDPEAALLAWPHEFSGGMRQRMMLASVMLLAPALLIADEPTTALDAVVQRDVLELMVRLTREQHTAVLLISHDLPMVARYTDRVIVMEQGVVVESGATTQLLAAPREPYTRKLLEAIPRRQVARVLQETEEPPVVSVRGLVFDYPGKRRLFAKAPAKRVLHGIDLVVRPREVVAVVGGSGSGKTTLGRTIAGLLSPTGGDILFRGRPIERGDAHWQDYRLNCQMVFQDPYSSLNPRMTIAQLVGEGLRLVPGMTNADRRTRVASMLRDVGLQDSFADRYAHELSGGQRQRVAIARALVRRPSFVIADEPVSALDVTVRAQVLALLAELQDRYGFSCLFISHDLGVVEQVADRVIVMQAGRIIEQGSRDTVFDQPQQAYTKKLLSAIPALKPTAAGGVQLEWRFDADAAETAVSAVPAMPAEAALHAA